jgi:hypothetical protein
LGFLLPTLDLAVAGATNDVQLAERIECRAFFEVEASAPPEGGHSVDTQSQDVFPDIKGEIVNPVQRGHGPDWSLLFGTFFRMTKSLRKAYFLMEKLGSLERKFPRLRGVFLNFSTLKTF